MPTDARGSFGLQQLAAHPTEQHQLQLKHHSLQMDVQQPQFAQPRSVNHIPQQYSWDCGLACVLMVLRALGCSNCDFHTLRRLSQTTSVWTVDLAYLLAHFGASVTFCTITIGINDDYANEWFYMEHLEHDEARVQQLFKQADQLGIAVQQRSVPLAELVEAVGSGQQLAILLVDRRKIDPWQAAADIAWNYTTGVTSATSYTGHYILLVGYEPPVTAGKAAAGAAGGVEPNEPGAGGSSSSTSSTSSSSSTSTSASSCRVEEQRPAAQQEAAGQQQQQQQLAVQGNVQADAAAFLVSSRSTRITSSCCAEQTGAAAATAATEPPGHDGDAASKAAVAAGRLGYFWVQDPAHAHGPTRVPVSVVEAARKSFGTDEDLLLVKLAVPLAAPSSCQAAAAPTAACSENSSWWTAAVAAAGASAPSLGLQGGFQQQAPEGEDVHMCTQPCGQAVTLESGQRQFQQEQGLGQLNVCNSTLQQAAADCRPGLVSCGTGATTAVSYSGCETGTSACSSKSSTAMLPSRYG